MVCHNHTRLEGALLGDTVELLNSAPLPGGQAASGGFFHLLLYFTIEPAKECAGVLEAYLSERTPPGGSGRKR